MFLLFAGSTYYPSGGWHDYRGCFNSQEAAVAAAKADPSFDWWHVVCGISIVASA
jgi:hypothetical protein